MKILLQAVLVRLANSTSPYAADPLYQAYAGDEIALSLLFNESSTCNEETSFITRYPVDYSLICISQVSANLTVHAEKSNLNFFYYEEQQFLQLLTAPGMLDQNSSFIQLDTEFPQSNYPLNISLVLRDKYKNTIGDICSENAIQLYLENDYQLLETFGVDGSCIFTISINSTSATQWITLRGQFFDIPIGEEIKFEITYGNQYLRIMNVLSSIFLFISMAVLIIFILVQNKKCNSGKELSENEASVKTVSMVSMSQ